MNKCEILYWTIGIIHSEHTIAEETPIQPVYAKGCKGYVELLPEFVVGLRDLSDFSHIYLIYHFHKSREVKLIVKPFLQDIDRGIFSTRAPCRPNPIGLSVVELLGIEGNILHLDGVDILDGTPLLDIKPYTAKFDLRNVTKNGWQDEVDQETAEKRGKRGYRS
jgi:tRNA-Thr(GGU) m(6)t(6)A37 methyltransferase TsaA